MEVLHCSALNVVTWCSMSLRTPYCLHTHERVCVQGLVQKKHQWVVTPPQHPQMLKHGHLCGHHKWATRVIMCVPTMCWWSRLWVLFLWSLYTLYILLVKCRALWDKDEWVRDGIVVKSGYWDKPEHQVRATCNDTHKHQRFSSWLYCEV